MAALPSIPAHFKPIQHYMKTATEHDKRDEAVAYYCKCWATFGANQCLTDWSNCAELQSCQLSFLCKQTCLESDDSQSNESECDGCFTVYS